MNPVPTYAELYDIVLQFTEPYANAEALYYAKRLIEGEAAIDRLYDPVGGPDDLLPVYRVKCKYVLKMLYRYLLSNVECTDNRESLMISQNDLAAVFGYGAYTLAVAGGLYELLAETRIIVPAGEAPERNVTQPVLLLPVELWVRPEHPEHFVF